MWIKIDRDTYLRPSHLRLFQQEGDRWAALGDDYTLASGLTRVEAEAFVARVMGDEPRMEADVREIEKEYELK